MTLKEQVKQRRMELEGIVFDKDGNISYNLAKHCMAAELKAERKGILFCHPELDSEGGISIVIGSYKEFALKRKIEIDRELSELENL